MFNFLRRKDEKYIGDKKTSNNTNMYKAAGKAIGLGAKFGFQDAIQQAFIKTAPDSFENMIKNLQKKWGRVPSLDECREHLHKQGSFMSATEKMGIDSEVLDGILEGSYNKVIGK